MRSGLHTPMRVFALAAWILITVPSGAGAAPFRQRPVLRIDRVDASKPPMVRIYLTELDSSGKVPAAKAQRYQLLVNNLPQPQPTRVERFIDRQEAVALTLVVQVAPSMGSVFKQIIDGSQRLLDGLPPGSQVGLIAYADVVVKELKPTSVALAKKAIAQLAVREALEMQLPDAIRDAIDGLASPRLPKHRKVLVISDGITADIKLRTFSQLGRRAHTQGVAIHSIGFAPLEPARLRTLFTTSGRSGGTFRPTSSPEQLNAAFAAFRAELRQQRVLSYELPKHFIGKVTDFQITAGDGLGSNIVQAELVKWKLGQKVGEISKWYASPLFIILVIAGVLILLTLVGVVLWKMRSKRNELLQRKLARMRNEEDGGEESYDDDDDDSEYEEDFYGGGEVPVGNFASFGQPATATPSAAEPAPQPQPAAAQPAAAQPAAAQPATQPPTPAAPVAQSPQPAPAPAPMAVAPAPVSPISPTAPVSSPAPAPVAPTPSASGGGIPLLPSPTMFLRQAKGEAAPTPAAAAAPAPAAAPVVPLPHPSAVVGAAATPAAAAPVLPPDPLLPAPARAPAPTFGFSGRKTQVLALEEVEQVDVVAWIVPLVGSFETLVLRDGFRVAVGGGDYVVEPRAGQPSEATFRLDPNGNWALLTGPVAGGSGAAADALRDNDRFGVGATEFLFKTAARFGKDGQSSSCLQVVGGIDDGRQVALPEGVPVCIGAHQSCSGMIRGEGVGARHLLVQLDGGTCHVADLGCDTGMQAAGKPVGRAALNPNEEIQVGSIRLIFRTENKVGAPA